MTTTTMPYPILAVLSFLASAALFIGTGMLDTRAGYESPWKPLCTATGVLAFACALWVLYYLLPLITLAVGLALITGIIGLVVGVWRMRG